ncbi:hypothetical protein SELSPUOL_01433 [Selenomonas sputigena ATCC 35185]|uniref:Uncharacterized protein n=1 Tax=Selenomonas sputigena (strain ATCC 35185 / DSM 20758 / CCUG 44933 / VPI D19B-28) TaxID=546271 RepID=C9LVD9_SELS3|nr:hypothetical protein SELSPUOL_01433 [Selenomonas sputigena ATCC 35185]
MKIPPYAYMRKPPAAARSKGAAERAIFLPRHISCRLMGTNEPFPISSRKGMMSY